MKKYICDEGDYFPMIKNSWGWNREEYSFEELESFYESLKLFINLSFEEIEEIFKVY